MKRIALLIALLCAPAFAVSWPTKPNSTDNVRNIYAPCPDRLAVLYLLNEGSGTTLTNLGKRASADGVANAATWTTDAYGALFDTFGHAAAASGDETYPRGTMFALVKFPDATQKAAITIASQNPATGAVNSIALAGNVGAVAGVLNYSKTNTAGTNDVLAVATGQAAGTWIPAAVSWGERGTLLATPWGNDTGTDTTPVIILDGNYVYLNASNAGVGAAQRMHILAWWDWQLTDREIAELFADPFLSGRPPVEPATGAWTTHVGSPICGRATATSLTWQIGGAATIQESPTLSWRIVYETVGANTPSGIYGAAADATTLGFVNASTTGWTAHDDAYNYLPDTITVTGLTAGTLYHWRAEYKDSTNTAIRAWPGGVGYARTQRASGGFAFAMTSDCHDGPQNHGVDPLPTFKRGLDNDDTGTHALTELRAWVGTRDLLEYAWSHAIDFTMDGGDSHFAFMDSGWLGVRVDQFKTGAYYQVMGNHEKARGDVLEVAAGADERMVDALIVGRIMAPNPITRGTCTYPQCGEDEGVPADPYDCSGTWCSGVSWIPSTPGCAPVGENVSERIDAEWLTCEAAQASSVLYLEYNTSGATWDDKLGPLEWVSSNGLGNYFAFSWGNAEFFVLDPWLYSAVGSSRHDDVRLTNSDFRLGARQWAWYEAALNASTAAWKFTCLHNHPGGVEGDEDGDGPNLYYSRGSGANSYSNENIRLQQNQREHAAVILKGHDHVFADVVAQGVQAITTGNLGSKVPYGSRSSEYDYPLDYGTQHLHGQDQPGMRYMEGHRGWCLFEIASDTAATVSYRETVVDQHDPRDEDPFDLDDSYWLLEARYIGEPLNVTSNGASSNGVIALVDATGTNSVPEDVLVVCTADDGDFYTYNKTAAIYNATAGAGGHNTYSQTGQDWGADGSCIAVSDWIEPHADNVILAGLAGGQTARVDWAPRFVYTAALVKGTTGSTESSGSAVFWAGRGNYMAENGVFWAGGY